MFFMRPSMSHMIHDGGQLYYAHVDKAVQDTNSRNNFLVVMSGDSRPEWGSELLYITSDNREMLLKHMRVNWETDHMWRLGKYETFPLYVHQLTTENKDIPLVHPFHGWFWEQHHEYKFMLPEEFEQTPNSIHNKDTGEYIMKKTGVTVLVHVHEMLTLDQLKQLDRDDIRWVAYEYKNQLLSAEPEFYILRNRARQKHMNLAGDLAAWPAWELVIRTRAATIICGILRRLYIPPVCNCAQDIAVIMRVPMSEKIGIESIDGNVRIARLIVDSVCPSVSAFSVYREVLQAKLDTLRFDEDAMAWIASHLKLHTTHRVCAKRFVRTVMRMYITDVGTRPLGLREDDDILERPANKAIVNAIDNEEWAELTDIPDLEDFLRQLRDPSESRGLKPLGIEASRFEQRQLAQACNQWFWRLSRYFTSMLDGGLLGNAFNIDIMIENLHQLDDKNMKLSEYVLYFMLHFRSRDMVEGWKETNLAKTLMDPDVLRTRVYNDSVMLALLRTEYIKKLFARSNELDFYKALSNLLMSNSGVALKAYICRMLMPTTNLDGMVASIIIPPLLQLFTSKGAYLPTYSAAALVNLSHGNEEVKRMLIIGRIADLAYRQLQSKDEDLVCYTLMLLSNLTKEAHTRELIAAAGILLCVYDLLTSSYQQCRPRSGPSVELSASGVSAVLREKVLAQVCIIIGQFCNDDIYREKFIETFPHTVKCMLYINEHSVAGSQLASKAMFAIKQVCVKTDWLKAEIGDVVIPKIVREFNDEKIEKNQEFLNQAVLLLQVLATLRHNCFRMVDLMLQTDTSPNTFERIEKRARAQHWTETETRITTLREILADTQKPLPQAS